LKHTRRKCSWHCPCRQSKRSLSPLQFSSTHDSESDPDKDGSTHSAVACQTFPKEYGPDPDAAGHGGDADGQQDVLSPEKLLAVEASPEGRLQEDGGEGDASLAADLGEHDEYEANIQEQIDWLRNHGIRDDSSDEGCRCSPSV
jgi:hypothetical protein